MIGEIARQKKKALEELKRDPKCRRLRCENVQPAIDAMADVLGAIKALLAMLDHNNTYALWQMGLAAEKVHLSKQTLKQMKIVFGYLKVLEFVINTPIDFYSGDGLEAIIDNLIETGLEIYGIRNDQEISADLANAAKDVLSLGAQLHGIKKELHEEITKQLKQGASSQDIGKTISKHKSKMKRTIGGFLAKQAIKKAIKKLIEYGFKKENQRYVNMYQESHVAYMQYRIAQGLAKRALSKAQSLQNDIQSTFNALQRAVDVCNVNAKINKCYEAFDRAVKQAQEKLNRAKKDYEHALAEAQEPVKNLRKRIREIKMKIDKNHNKISGINKYVRMKLKLADLKKSHSITSFHTEIDKYWNCKCLR